MSFQNTPFIIPLLAAVIINAALGGYALRRRAAGNVAHTGLAFAAVTFAIALWSLAYILELSGTDLPTKQFWSNASFLGIVAAPTAWLIFALIYSGHRHWINWRSLALLGVVPLLTLGLVWSSSWHQLFWTSAVLRQHGAYSTLQTGFGPGFYFHTFYSYLLILAGSVLIVREQISAPRLFWGQRLTLLLSLLFPWIASVLNLLRIPPWDALDPTPFAFTLTGLVLAWSLFGLRLLDLAPLARQEVIENLADGLLVLDLSGRLVDCNQAAQRILQMPLQPLIGQPVEKLFGAWPELKAIANQKFERMERPASGAANEQPTSGAQASRQSIDFSISPVYDARRNLVGRSIVLHEVTRGFQSTLKQAESALKQRTAFLEALTQVSAASVQSQNLSEVLSAALDQALGALQLEAGCAWYQEFVIRRSLDDEQGQALLSALTGVGLLQELSAQPSVQVEDWAALSPEDQLPGVQALLLVPLQAFGRVTGRLAVLSPQPRTWSDEEIMLLRAIAQQVGLAGERLSSIERSQQYAELVSRLVTYSEALNTSMSEDEVLAAICQGARNLIGADRVDVQTLGAGVEEGAEAGPDELVSPRAASQGAPTSTLRPRAVLVPDVRQQLANLNDPQVEQSIDYQALGIWPLVCQETTLAMLRCYYDHPYHWSEIEQEVMQAFSRQAAVALESTRLFAAERRQRALAETLRELAVQLSGALNLGEILERAFHSLERVLDYDLVHILAVEAGRVRVVHSHGFSGSELEKLQAGLHQREIGEIPGMRAVSASLLPELLSDTRDDAAWTAFWKATRARSYLAVPVLRQGELIALINLFSRQPGSYSPQQVRHLQAVANQVAVAAHNAFLYDSLQKQAAETTALYRSLSRLFNPGGEVRQVAEQIAQAVLAEFDDIFASVMLADEAGKELKILVWTGYPMLTDVRLWLDGPGLTVAAYNSGETIYVPDVCQEPRYVAGANQTCSELVLPLQARGQVIGVLNLEHPQTNAFDESSRRVLGVFAEHAALALENALLFETASLQLRQMNLLNEITRISLTEVGLDAMLQQVADRTRELFNANGCSIMLWDETNQRILPGAVSGQNLMQYDKLQSDPDGPSITEYVLETGQILVVEDLAAANVMSAQAEHGFTVVSALGVPLIANQQKYGAAILGYQLKHHFSPREVALGDQAGGQIALAIARARLLELSQRRAREAENLRQASEALTGALDLAKVLPNILKHLARVIPFDSASVFLMEPEGMKAVSAVGPPEMNALVGQFYPADNPLSKEIMQRHRPLILGDAQAETRFANWGGVTHIHGWMGVPLVSQGKAIGFLTIDSRQVNAFDSEQARLAQAFASQVAIAIETARLFDEVQRLAVTDPLTGLFNRRGYTELGRREIERARRYKRSLAAIMLDIDHFKQINDQYKHATGDEVLRELAVRCRERMREIDILGRYGGEEFVLLLPETDLNGALRAAESLRERVAKYPFRTQAGALKVTISLGVAVYAGGEMDLEKLLDRADDAMYAAKQGGRNQVRAFDAAK